MLTPSYKLYGVPLSQPFRSVAWTLLLKGMAFETQLVAPGSPHPKNGSLGDDFRILTGHRSTTTPVLWDRNVDDAEGNEGEDGFVVLESAAILTYLCHKHSWDDLYPPPAKGSLGRRRATIDSYLHWHHNGTRQLSQLVQPALRPDLPQTESHPARLEKARIVLSQLEHGWLGTLREATNHDHKNEGPFLAGNPHPTIADILCYGEISQAVLLGALNLDHNDKDGNNNNDYIRLRAWSDEMRRLPYHDEVHAALFALGNIGAAETETHGADVCVGSSNEPTTRIPPLSKRLGRVTRVGLEAIQRAQDNYRTN